MLRTGKDLSQGQAFHRRLLSEYNTDITLDNYVSYFELKPLAKKVEKIRQELEAKYRHRYKHRGTASSVISLCSPNETLTPRNPAEKTVTHDFVPLHLSPPITPNSTRDVKAMPTIAATAREAVMLSASDQAIAVSVPSALIAEENRTSSTAVFVDPLSPFFFQTPGFTELRKTDEAFARLLHDRIDLQEQFFSKLRDSYVKVKEHVAKLERDFVDAAAELRTFSEQHLRQDLPRNYIPALYLKLGIIMKYRGLNLMAFRKIMKKFLERCACDSLELQQRVLKIDRIIHASNVAQPSLDLRSAALDLVGVYGTVFKLTYEETMAHMHMYEHRTGRTARRILPNSQTFFAADAFPHHERPGNFAVRVLGGTCSLFCEKMITEVLQCPRYPSNSCGRFANGEISVNLAGPVRGDDVFIVQSMVGLESENLSNSGAHMELALLIHSVQLAAAARITAVVPFLAYTRNVASISAVAEMLEAMGCHHVITVDMHSDQVEGMFSIPMESISAMYEFVRYVSMLLKEEGNDFTNITVVAPSGDFLGRAKEFADALMRYNDLDSERQFVSVCTAVKRVETRQAASDTPTLSRRGAGPATGDGNLSHGAAGRLAYPAGTNSISSTTLAAPAQTEGGLAVPPPLPQQNSIPIVVPSIDGANDGTSTTPTSSGFGSVDLHQLMATSPVAVSVGSYPTPSNTSPNVADSATAELTQLARNSANMNHNTPQHSQHTHLTAAGNSQARQGGMHHSASTFGIERALKQQEEGRQSVVRKVEEVRTEYKNYALVGEAKNRLCIIVETVVDEAVKISQVAKSLHANGAERIILVATHAVMSASSIERLIEAPIDLIVVTDSVNQDVLMRNPKLAQKLRVVPIAPLLARAIEKIHTENCLATLFDKS